MTISFSQIPSNLRAPFVWFEFDSSEAGGTPDQVYPTLLIGPRRTGVGSGINDTLARLSSAAEAASLWGVGSVLHRMAIAARAGNPNGELWSIGVADPAGVAASLGLTVTGPATGSGTISMYIAGTLVQCTVTSGDTANNIAANLTTAINAVTSLPLTAANTGAPSAVVDLTCKHLGLVGNAIDCRVNYRGAVSNEVYPAGVTVTTTVGAVDLALTPRRLAGGTGAPTLTTAIANLRDIPFDYVAVPWNDDTTLDTIEAEWNHTAGRWSPLRPVYGHVFAAIDDTLATVTSGGNARNSAHSSLFAPGDARAATSCAAPSPSWEIAAAAASACSRARQARKSAVYGTLELVGILGPIEGDRFSAAEESILMTDGVTPLYVDPGGAVRLRPVLTTWQTDAFSQPNEAWLDLTTVSDLTYINRDYRTYMTGKYPAHRLADNGTRFGPGSNLVTPDMIEGDTIALYKKWEGEGVVENAAAFIANSIFERDGTNPKRLNVELGPDLTNGFEVMAVKNKFRRQYAA